MKSALIIGDSFVEGSGATGRHGWAYQVAEAIPHIDFDIQGVGGDTAERVNARWPDKTYDLVILQVGTNDCAWKDEKAGPEVAPERFLKYLARIHERLRPPVATRMVIVGLFDVDERLTNPIGPGKRFTHAGVAQFDALIARFAKRHEVDLVTLRDKPIKPKWLSDGVHPNDLGHAWIANHVIKTLWRIEPATRPLGESASTA